MRGLPVTTQNTNSPPPEITKLRNIEKSNLFQQTSFHVVFNNCFFYTRKEKHSSKKGGRICFENVEPIAMVMTILYMYKLLALPFFQINVRTLLNLSGFPTNSSGNHLIDRLQSESKAHILKFQRLTHRLSSLFLQALKLSVRLLVDFVNCRTFEGVKRHNSRHWKSVESGSVEFGHTRMIQNTEL